MRLILFCFRFVAFTYASTKCVCCCCCLLGPFCWYFFVGNSNTAHTFTVFLSIVLATVRFIVLVCVHCDWIMATQLIKFTAGWYEQMGLQNCPRPKWILGLAQSNVLSEIENPAYLPDSNKNVHIIMSKPSNTDKQIWAMASIRFDFELWERKKNEWTNEVNGDIKPFHDVIIAAFFSIFHSGGLCLFFTCCLFVKSHSMVVVVVVILLLYVFFVVLVVVVVSLCVCRILI